MPKMVFSREMVLSFYHFRSICVWQQPCVSYTLESVEIIAFGETIVDAF